MFNPVSTYRIQFNKDFTFSDFLKNFEYFKLLGAGSIYASPIFEAVPGSMHGYDVVDPLSINKEIGSITDFAELSARLHSAGIGWIQDIVPNHMAFHMNNQWLHDVLEKGVSSEFSSFFDIDFSHPAFDGKLMIPFLGKNPDEAIRDKELKVDWLNGSFIFIYFDNYFPFSPESTRMVNELPRLRQFTSGQDIFIKNALDLINSDKTILQYLLEMQNYRLSKWEESSSKINYRRFFTITSLICLNMENDHVFDSYHHFIEKELAERRIDGIRVDHLDGLKNPVKYLEKLRNLAGDDKYIVAEKILGRNELLPYELPLQGTTGYDFLGMINNLLTWKEGAGELEKFYRKVSGIKETANEMIYRRKKFILTEMMAGEWENLTRMLAESGLVVFDENITRDSLKNVLREFLALFPSYRFYSDRFPLTNEEIRLLGMVFEKAVEKEPSLEKAIIALGNVLIYQEGFNKEMKSKALEFFLRCMQFTGPLMAKGVEDTVMYEYNSFIGHNDVGDEPGPGGLSIVEFHERMQQRQRLWPMTMNATATHDTKRGEDVRARLNVISEMPEEWKESIKRWKIINKKFRHQNEKGYIPNDNEEYFIYQTIAGTFPFNGKPDEKYLKRLKEYLVKSLREAKVNSNWDKTDTEYEQVVAGFTRKILDNPVFLVDFKTFHTRISAFGIINSLTQLALKATCPGIPDFYQGTELWDLSMVDPDNRRPVDYGERYRLLKELLLKKDIPGMFAKDLFPNRNDGRIKLMFTYLLMAERWEDPDLFAHGSYLPLQVTGKFEKHIISYARVFKNRWFIMVAPLYLSLLSDSDKNINWEDTAIIFPEMAPRKWSSPLILNDFVADGQMSVSEIMKFPCPVFFTGQRKMHERSSGVLAHVSSLPGKYGVGDFGPVAYDFADLLHNSGQRYWQVLPLNPVGKGYAYSPYSSTSSFAGNTFFISPELLVRSGLVNEDATLEIKFRETNRTSYDKAAELRKSLLSEANDIFFSIDRPHERMLFSEFCEKQKFWLDDFSLFEVLRKEFGGAPWNKWSSELKNRDSRAIDSVRIKYESEIRREKLAQYLFQRQWMKLKEYCNVNDIRIIGDVSFYVNYDSVEVWSHPEIFKLDAGRNPRFVAGVPPDYFSKTGQLWNMPVYDWKNNRKNVFEWWMNRIRRNLELCDLLRFDHFRGFSRYWEVPSGETTSVNGKWVDGPGKKFFDRVRSEFPSMPFIAEDLGDIDDNVYQLRDDFSLPGMVVLQFALGPDTPDSPYIPHNYVHNSVVYTGTHDNNTTRGWYINDLDEKTRKTAEEYVGHHITADSCREDFIRLAYSSVTGMAIIPVQDILNLDEKARLNKPSTSEKNWLWKMTKADLKNDFFRRLGSMAVLYGRV